MSHAMVGVATGFAIFCVGGVARAYMDFSANGMKMFSDFRRGNTELAYWKLVKEGHAPVLPFFLSVVCIPLGVVIAFGSILWSNHVTH